MIPATSPLRYIGGMAALNLPSPTGTGDWHMEQTFFRQREHRSRSFISGVGCPTDTTHILGEAGVYDCTAVLDELGIPHESAVAYAANHARAIADLVLAAVLRGESPAFVVLDDWMPRDSDKQQVFDLLAKALGHLTEGQRVGDAKTPPTHKSRHFLHREAQPTPRGLARGFVGVFRCDVPRRPEGVTPPPGVRVSHPAAGRCQVSPRVPFPVRVNAPLTGCFVHHVFALSPLLFPVLRAFLFLPSYHSHGLGIPLVR